MVVHYYCAWVARRLRRFLCAIAPSSPSWVSRQTYRHGRTVEKPDTTCVIQCVPPPPNVCAKGHFKETWVIFKINAREKKCNFHGSKSSLIIHQAAIAFSRSRGPACRRFFSPTEKGCIHQARYCAPSPCHPVLCTHPCWWEGIKLWKSHVLFDSPWRTLV